jgi:hypothetical protein
MAAVPKFYETNGDAGSPTTTALSALVFTTSDEYAPGNEHPLVKPTSGTNRSWVKSLAVGFSTGPATSCSDIKIYCDGTIGWTGITWYVGDQFPTTYVQATGTEGDTGNVMTTVYTGVVTSKTNFQNYTSAAPLTLSMAKTTGTGAYTNYFIMQLDLSTSAVVGALSAEALTTTWLEV